MRRRLRLLTRGSRPAGVRASRAGVALVLAPLLLPPLVAPPAQAQERPRAQASPSAAPEQSGTLVVSDIRPRAPRPEDPFQVLGTVTNTSDRPIRDVRVQLLRGQRLLSRSEIERFDSDADPAFSRVVGSSEVAEEMAPGGSARLDLRTLVSRLQLDRGVIGVYPLLIRVTARDDSDRSIVVDEARTYLPWFGAEKPTKLRVAFVVPVLDQPRRTPLVDVRPGQLDERMVDDELRGLLDRAGRLGALLEGVQQNTTNCQAAEPGLPEGVRTRAPAPERAPGTCTRTPVTFAVDPDLLLSASAMTAAYEVQPSSTAKVQPKEPSPEATAFLAGLRAAAHGPDDLLALPYGDPDVVAVTGLGSSLDGQVPDARAIGTRLTTDLAGAPLDTVALAPPGPVTPEALDALSAGGTTRAVVLDPTALVGPDEMGITPGTRAALPPTTSGPLTGLVVDERLSRLLVTDPDEDGGTDLRLLEQRWLVETAMISAEDPNAARTLVVQLPRQEKVDPLRLRAALTDTGRVPWMCGVPLDAVAREAEGCAGQVATAAAEPDRDGTLATAGTAPVGASLTPLSKGVLDRVTALRDRGDQLTASILASDSERTDALRLRLKRGLLRSLSTAWRTEAGEGSQLTGRMEDGLDAAYAKIALGTGAVLLTSKDSRLEVTVTNTLSTPIDVQVQLGDETTAARLTVDRPRVQRVLPGNLVPFTFDAETSTSGRFLVPVYLLDRDGNVIGRAQELEVRSTRYGTLALAVTGIAAAVLLVAAGVRITRRAVRAGRRSSRRSSPA